MRCHLPLAVRCFLTLVMRTSAASVPRPIPEKEWIVVPPMLQAAMPVEAVTATASPAAPYLRLRDEMISRRRTDFPVPALDPASAPPITQRAKEKDAYLPSP